MKKLVKVAAILAVALLAFASCNHEPADESGDSGAGTTQNGGSGTGSSGADSSSSGYKLPEGAVALQLYKKTTDEVTDADKAASVTIGDYTTPYAFVQKGDFDELAEGTKIYFSVECGDDGKFRVDNWDWNPIVKSIYDATSGSEIKGTDVTDKTGVKYEYSKSGNYYFVMDAAAKSALAGALEFHGQKATISKVAYVAQ